MNGEWYDQIAAKIFLQYFEIKSEVDRKNKEEALFKKISDHTGLLVKKMKLLYYAYIYDLVGEVLVKEVDNNKKPVFDYPEFESLIEVFTPEDKILFQNVLLEEARTNSTHHNLTYLKHLYRPELNADNELDNFIQNNWQIIELIAAREKIVRKKKKYIEAFENIFAIELENLCTLREMHHAKISYAKACGDDELAKKYLHDLALLDKEFYEKKESYKAELDPLRLGRDTNSQLAQLKLEEINKNIKSIRENPVVLEKNVKISTKNLPVEKAAIALLILNRLCQQAYQALNGNLSADKIEKIKVDNFPFEEFFIPCLDIAIQDIDMDGRTMSKFSRHFLNGKFTVVAEDKSKNYDDSLRLFEWATQILEFDIEFNTQDFLEILNQFGTIEDFGKIQNWIKDWSEESEDLKNGLEDLINKKYEKTNKTLPIDLSPDDNNFCNNLFNKVRKVFGESDVVTRNRIVPILKEGINQTIEATDLYQIWNYVDNSPILKTEKIYNSLTMMGLFKGNYTEIDPFSNLILALRKQALEIAKKELNDDEVDMLRKIILQKINGEIDTKALEAFNELHPYKKVTFQEFYN